MKPLVTTAPAVQILDPLADSRWSELVERDRLSSVFHTTGWLEALERTYGYKPLVVSTSQPAQKLQDGWVFCCVDSWVTGRRWVSLPFSDHCEPLCDGSSTSEEQLVLALGEAMRLNRPEYAETRRLTECRFQLLPEMGCARESYWLHHIDLGSDLTTLFRRCHKNSTQRKIERAQREQLAYEEGRSTSLLNAFYDLQLLTRRRHGLPPQPKTWFQNILTCLGDSATIRVAYKARKPVAAILTLRHKATMVYKYACADAAFNNLGGTQMLLWRAIADAKSQGLHTLDLGRSNFQHEGLVRFKDQWGSIRSILHYSQFRQGPGRGGNSMHLSGSRLDRLSKAVIPYLPTPVFRMVGNILYRHIG